jgi:hypothetical protein
MRYDSFCDAVFWCFLRVCFRKIFDDIEEEEDAPGVVLQYLQARVHPRIGFFLRRRTGAFHAYFQVNLYILQLLQQSLNLSPHLELCLRYLLNLPFLFQLLAHHNSFQLKQPSTPPHRHSRPCRVV